MESMLTSRATLSILLVEDDKMASKMISMVIAHKFPGVVIHIAENGMQGLELFRKHMPDLVITDINMLEMGGIQMAMEIKAAVPETIIIAISAHSDVHFLLNAIEIGISHYLLKPVDLEKLVSLIEKSIAGINLVWQVREQAIEIQRLSSFPLLNPSPILELDADGKVTFCNMAADKNEVNKGGTDGAKLFIPDNLPEILREMQENSSEQHELEIEINGEFYVEHIHLVPQFNSIRIYATNITKRKQAEKELRESEGRFRELSFLDPLTGLSNRRLFEDRLEQAIAKSRRHGKLFGLMTLDLDNFKKLNDTFGHDVGDQVLREAAERIRACCKRDFDTISRLGGDEFSIILTDCGGREQLSDIAGQLLLQFERPFQLDDSQVEVTTSIGISLFPDNGTVSKELEIASDRAMYAAKKAGRNTFRIWEPYTAPRTAF